MAILNVTYLVYHRPSLVTVYFLLIPHSHRHSHVLVLAVLKNGCVEILRSLVMALIGFSVLLFVPPIPEVLAEIKRTIYSLHCIFPLAIL